MRLQRLVGKTVLVSTLALANLLSRPSGAAAFSGGGCGLYVQGWNLECDIYFRDAMDLCMFGCGCIGMNWQCGACSDGDECWLDCGCTTE